MNIDRRDEHENNEKAYFLQYSLHVDFGFGSRDGAVSSDLGSFYIPKVFAGVLLQYLGHSRGIRLGKLRGSLGKNKLWQELHE